MGAVHVVSEGEGGVLLEREERALEPVQLVGARSISSIRPGQEVGARAGVVAARACAWRWSAAAPARPSVPVRRGVVPDARVGLEIAAQLHHAG